MEVLEVIKSVFRIRCHPKGNLRARQIEKFLELMQATFSVTAWLKSSLDQPTVTKAEDIEKYLTERQSKRSRPEHGVDWDLFSFLSEGKIWIAIHTGTRSFFKDHYDVYHGRALRRPDLRFFKQSILLFRPFEAFLAEEKNEAELNATGRQHLYPHFERPAILRWFHYMDQQLCESIGGVAHCLQTPAFRVEPFCDGVLFQITEDQFDADNPEHKEAQAKAMRFLGL